MSRIGKELSIKNSKNKEVNLKKQINEMEEEMESLRKEMQDRKSDSKTAKNEEILNSLHKRGIIDSEGNLIEEIFFCA